MIKMFAVMYILCSIYTSNPDTMDNPYLQSKAGNILSQSIYYSTINGQIAIADITENKPIDIIEELKLLNYYKDEYKDSKLNERNAILRFQSDHNLPVSGEWNDESLAALKERIKSGIHCYSDTVKDPPSDKIWLVINKTKRILTVYENDSVIKKYPVAIGNPPSLTPSGKFKISSKVIDPSWGGGGYAKPVAGGSPNNPLGKRWLGLSLKGGSRYGIHGNNSPYSIGKNVSHGCIRMINSDVEELFKITPISSNVWIGTENELSKWGVVQKEMIP